MKIFGISLGGLDGKTSKINEKVKLIKEPSSEGLMVEMPLSDCAVIAGGPQVQNDTEA